MKDGSEIHYLATEGIYMESLWLRDHKERMQMLLDRLDYNLNPDNIPTWASSELAMAMMKERKK